jgi:hypothetical protein
MTPACGEVQWRTTNVVLLRSRRAMSKEALDDLVIATMGCNSHCITASRLVTFLHLSARI